MPSCSSSPRLLPSSAQPGGIRCATPVENEVIAHAQAVISEVERLVVKCGVMQNDVVRGVASKKSRENCHVCRGKDNNPPGERNAIDDGRVTVRLVREH